MLHAPARQTEPVYVTDQTLMRSYLALFLLFLCQLRTLSVASTNIFCVNQQDVPQENNFLL